MNIVGDFLQILHMCNQHGSQFDKITMGWIFNFNYGKNYKKIFKIGLIFDPVLACFFTLKSKFFSRRLCDL